MLAQSKVHKSKFYRDLWSWFENEEDWTQNKNIISSWVHYLLLWMRFNGQRPKSFKNQFFSHSFTLMFRSKNFCLRERKKKKNQQMVLLKLQSTDNIWLLCRRKKKCTRTWESHSNGALQKPLSFIKFVNYTHWMCAWAGCFFLLLRFIWFFLRFTLRFEKWSLFFTSFQYCVFFLSHFSNYFSCQNIFFFTVFTVYFFSVVCATQYVVVSVDRIEFFHWMCYIFHRLYQNQIGSLTQKGSQHNQQS